MRNRSKIGPALLAPLLFVSAAAAEEPAQTVPPRQPDNSQPKLPNLKPEQLTDAKAAALAADCLEQAFGTVKKPESVRMLIAILRGSQLGPNEGWFGPAESRYTWKWLAESQGANPPASSIGPKQFRGSESFFKRLDRDGDGRITAGDLDWSDRNTWIQQSYMVNRLFRRLNAKGDGKLTREELDEFFKKAGDGKDHLTVDDLRRAIIQPSGGGFQPGDAPSLPVLVRGLFAGELGSLNEGPKINEAAPNFTLKTVDGKSAIQLSKLYGEKPTVLVFGNFTCGPFRSYYPEVDFMQQRWKNEANFVMVYVREAHPTDGWHMVSNDHVGVSVKQPTSFGERVKVCDQFCQKLKPTMPVVVDEINDPVGNAYSGMPARMYVIDSQGKVAFKSGRGPFGFRVGEMEQALIMCLLEGEGKAIRKKP